MLKIVHERANKPFDVALANQYISKNKIQDPDVPDYFTCVITQVKRKFIKGNHERPCND